MVPVATQRSRSRPKPSSSSIRSSKRTISPAASDRIVEAVDQRRQRRIDLRVRVALGQEPHQRRPAPAGRRGRPGSPSAAPRGRSPARSHSCRDARRAGPARSPWTELPACSTGRCVRERPPRTRPRCRPWRSVISSTIRLVSPCRRVPMMIPSSLQSIGILAQIRALRDRRGQSCPYCAGTRSPSPGSARDRRPSSRAP